MIDRLGTSARFRPFKPEILGASYCGAFDHTCTRVAVASSTGPVLLVDTKSFATQRILPAGDPIVALTPLGDRVALLRKKRGLRLETWVPKGNDWVLEHAVPCDRQRELFAFGRGRVLMVGWTNQDDSWDGKAWPSTHFVAVDERGVRLLGTCGVAMSYALEQDGRSYLASDSFGMLELGKIDEALGNGKLVERLS